MIKLNNSVIGLFFSLSGLLVACSSPASGSTIVITQGGTYRGTYQSSSSSVPCVRVATSQPVVLEGCTLTGAGNLIEAAEGANLTVRNCRGQALAPSVDDQAPGRFLDAYRAQRLVIEHNDFAGTSGIVVNRWSGTGAPGHTLTVRYNRVRNIDGRWRNGGGSTRSSFLILNTVQQVPGMEVAYNEVVNTPNQSLVEDNINFYNSSGTAQSPARVHDNFVRGAYPFPATAGHFTGTGMTTDGDAATPDGATAYVEAFHNQFVSTCNAAMNIAAGHDVFFHDNRMVTSGLLPDGTRLQATYAATAVFNFYQQPGNVFYNNRVANNTIGYVKWGATIPYPDRQDLSPGNCAPCTGTAHLPNPITPATEDGEWQLWQQKIQQAGVTIGPVSASAPTPPPAAATGQVSNPGFEADGQPEGAPSGWQTTTGAGTNDNADNTETYPDAHSGNFHGTHYRPEAYEVYTHQTVRGLPNGTYAFKAWTKSTGGQPHAQLRAQDYGGPAVSANVPATPDGEWVQVTLSGVTVTIGQCDIGFYSRAGAGQWLYFDDVELVQQNTPPAVSLTTSATSVALGQALALSAAATDPDGTVATVEFFEGTTKLGETTGAPHQLSWTPTAAGSYALTARATDNAGATATSAVVTVTVAAPAPTPPVASVNAVLNPGFEADGGAVGSPSNWQTTTGAGTNDNADYTETHPGAHTGNFHGTHFRPEAYEVYTHQTVSNLPNGTYTLRAWVQGNSTQSQLQAQNHGGPVASVALPATGQWTQVSLSNVNVSNGQCEIGFYSKPGGGQWLYFDDVELLRQDGGTARVAAAAGTAPLYPNPATNQVTVSASYPRATVVVLALIDAQGVVVSEHRRQATAGPNQFTLDTANVPNGLYTLQVKSNQPLVRQRLQVQH